MRVPNRTHVFVEVDDRVTAYTDDDGRTVVVFEGADLSSPAVAFTVGHGRGGRLDDSMVVDLFRAAITAANRERANRQQNLDPAEAFG